MYWRFMDWLSDNPYRVYIAMGVLIVSVFSALLYFSVQEQKAWNEFAKAHECKVIAHQSGYTAYGYYNGKYQSYWVPSRDTYRCNDGIDYTR